MRRLVVEKCVLFLVIAALMLLAASGGVEAAPAKPHAAGPRKGEPWRGVHFIVPSRDRLAPLKRAIGEALAPLGVNVLILEVNYNYEFTSHPELRAPGALTQADAHELTALCRANGIKLIPMFNCLGHQSWAKNTGPLLVKYPELDETPQVPADNTGIYCRSWCPLHPEVNKIVFALMDELVAAFDADSIHVGMDEVFLIGSDQCPRCRGKDPATLFARAVNDYHDHFVAHKHLTLLLWGDRLIDSKEMSYGRWEAADNGTAPAVDRIPKDIIICDWHYEPRESYPSVPYFQAKGFRVWPSSWRDKDAALALLEYSREGATDRMIGHMCTTWSGADVVCQALLGEKTEDRQGAQAQQVAEALRACMERLRGR
jgi:hypothetical protein